MRRERDETFDAVDGHLIRKVVPGRGRPYEHRCPIEDYRNLAHAAEELGEVGFTLEDLAARAGTPNTPAAVALAFWKERSCVVTRFRRNFPASNILFEDAMTEFHALEHHMRTTVRKET